MSLSFGLPVYFLIPCLLAAGALGYWVYRNTIPALSPAKRAVLTALRVGALGIVLFLLFEPILQNIINKEQPPLLAVLVDDSQSLGLAEAGGSAPDSSDTSNAVRSSIKEVLNQSLNGDVLLYKFSDKTRFIPQNAIAPEDSILFQGHRTNVSQALAYVREDLKDQNLKGILLISDGQYNTGSNPLYLAERFPVPIHTVVVGDTARQRDIQIRRITTNDIAYVDDELPVQIGLLSEGFDGERVTVSLFERGVLLTSTNVDLPAGTAEIPIDVFHVPTAEGLHRYTVSVTNLDGEATYRNNSESFAVRVLQNKKRILLLAATPEPDVSAVRQVLATNPNMEVTPLIQKSRGSFYNQAFPDSLENFDAVILMGYPGPTADPAVVQRIASAIADGLPAFFILSRQTDLRSYKANFGDILPVTPRVLRTNFVESTINPSSEGLQHPLLQMPDGVDTPWMLLPPLVYNDSRWLAAPDARVLATQKVRGIALGDPLLVVLSRNRQRTAALLGAGTWRWKNLPEDLDAAAAFWPTLFSNTLQWIATREDDRPVRVAPVEDLFSGGASIQFTGQVYDESLNPVDGASIEIEVVAADTITYPYTMEPVGNGRYTLNIGALPEGTYQYTATASKNNAELGTDEGAFAVGTLTLEYKETRANSQLMGQIAQRSGGNVFENNNLTQLVRHLEGSNDFKSVFFQERIETELWQRYIFFILILLLITTEWFVRKRSGMV